MAGPVALVVGLAAVVADTAAGANLLGVERTVAVELVPVVRAVVVGFAQVADIVVVLTAFVVVASVEELLVERVAAETVSVVFAVQAVELALERPG